MAFRRDPERAQARTGRWQREDEATRLAVEVDQLRSLRIVIEEWRGDQLISGARYTKHVIVSRAPARFEVPCGDPKCQEGGYDITDDLMRGLRARATSIEGQSECRGTIGDKFCDRVVKFAATATYAASE